MGAFAQALNQAEARGLSLEQVADVVEFYRRHPGRWPPAVLFNRLTRPQAAHLAPHEGWFGELPAWTAQQQRKAYERAQETARDSPRRVTEPSDELQRLEARYGEQLDGLTQDEVARLFPPGHVLQGLVQRQGSKSRILRPELLKAIEQREKPG